MNQERQEDQQRAQQNQSALQRVSQGIASAIRLSSQAEQAAAQAAARITRPITQTVEAVTQAVQPTIQVLQFAMSPARRHLLALARAVSATGQAGATVSKAVLTASAAASPALVAAVLEEAHLGTVEQASAAAALLSASQANTLAEAITLTAAGDVRDPAAVLQDIAGHFIELYNPAMEHAEREARHNEAPVIAGISAREVPENHQVVVTVTAHDKEDGDLVQSFVIPAQDYETTKEVTIDAAFVDSGNLMGDGRLSVAQRFVLPVRDVNEAPVITGIDVVSVPENQTVTISVTAVDPEDGAIIKTYDIPAHDYEAGSAFILSTTITDSGGLLTVRDFRIVVTDLNEAPNTPTATASFDGQTLVVTVAATDPDGETLAPQFYTYSVQQLAAGVPSFMATFTDKGGLTSAILIEPPKLAAQAAADHLVPPTILGINRATVSENAIVQVTVTAYDAVDGVLTRTYTIPAQDYEVSQTAHLDATITNSSGLSASRGFDLQVTNVNEAPVFVSASPLTTPENQPLTIVATWRDPEQGLVTTTHALAPQDYETLHTTTVHLAFTDAGGLSAGRDQVISITNVNEAPTVTGPAVYTIQENRAFSAQLTRTDPDVGDAGTWSIVGARDGFSITAGGRLTHSSLDFEGDRQVSTTVRYTDAGGLYDDQTITLNATNVRDGVTALSVTGVSHNSDAHTITITFGATLGDTTGASTHVVYSPGFSTSANPHIHVSGNSVTLPDDSGGFRIGIKASLNGETFSDDVVGDTNSVTPPHF
jgi:hypothetical protein